MEEQMARRLVAAEGKKLQQAGLVARTWGNISCRIDENHFVITPSGLDYETMTARDLVLMDIRNGVLKKYSGNTKVLLIPDIVTEIDEAVFSGNKYIEEVELPNGLSEIQASLFSGCSNLKRVSIPDTVTVIGTKAFDMLLSRDYAF